VWKEISTRITVLRRAWNFEPKDVRDALTVFTRELAAPKTHELGCTFTPDEDHLQRQFKSVLPASMYN
jgi:aminopeptidase 2